MKATLFLALLTTMTLARADVMASQGAGPPGLREPIVTPAADGIFAAFQTHPLVGLGDEHGMAQEEDFYASLVRDKRFAKDVGNVVVEFGDAAQQETLDRYLTGEDVPYQYPPVWRPSGGNEIIRAPSTLRVVVTRSCVGS